MKKPPALTLQERNRLLRRNITVKNRKKIRKEKNKASSGSEEIELTLPSKFDLHGNQNETIKLIQRLHQTNNYKNKYNLTSLKFDDIKEINLSSALILASEIDVWNKKIQGRIQSNHEQWDAKIRLLLQEMGLFKLLKLPSIPVVENPLEKNTVFLQFLVSKTSDGQLAKKMREKIEEVLGRDLENKVHLYGSISEAFTNVIQHAYGKRERSPYWWIATAYHKDKEQITVALYDRGVGIPKTMKTFPRWRLLKEEYFKNDAALIAIAMRSSFDNKNNRTNTGQENRGKGLKELLSFIKERGTLTIISGKGYCTFEHKNEKLQTIEQKKMSYNLSGTLIEWNLNLPSKI